MLANSGQCVSALLTVGRGRSLYPRFEGMSSKGKFPRILSLPLRTKLELIFYRYMFFHLSLESNFHLLCQREGCGLPSLLTTSSPAGSKNTDILMHPQPFSYGSWALCAYFLGSPAGLQSSSLYVSPTEPHRGHEGKAWQRIAAEFLLGGPPLTAGRSCFQSGLLTSDWIHPSMQGHVLWGCWLTLGL